jgi:hypothetical protein
MVLVRGSVASAILFLLLSAAPAVAVTTLPYFPFSDGDYRVFHSSDGGLLYESISATTASATAVWADVITDAAGSALGDLYWKRDATSTRQIFGGHVQTYQVTFSPTIAYPDDLVVGGPLTTSGNILVGGLPLFTYTYSLTVESVDITQGPFTHCVQLLEEFTVFNGATPLYHTKVREWRQATLGLVALTPDVENAPLVIALLVYARTAGGDYGSLPAADGDFNGDTFLTELDAALLVDCYLGGPLAYAYVCDIYPTTAPDGVIDDNDLILFIALWRTAHGT